MDTSTALVEKMLAGEELISFHGETSGLFALAQDGKILFDGMSQAKALRMRDTYRAYFGGRFDIIETESYGVDGKVIGNGNAETFSHNRSHVPHDVPLYDVHIDDALVAKDMTIDAANAFIAESVDTLDIFAAIAEAVASPEFSLEDILHTIATMSRAQYYGVTTVRYAPVENVAPPPAQSETNWRVRDAMEKSALRNAKVAKTREFEYIATPQEYREFSVINVATFEVYYSGTRKSCIAYMMMRVSKRGEKMHNMRVTRYGDTAYRMNVDIFGYSLMQRGETICRGTKKEVFDYIVNGLATKTLNRESCKVVKN